MPDLSSLSPFFLVAGGLALVMLVWDTVEVGRNDAANLVNGVFGLGDAADKILEIVAKAEHAEWETDKAQFELAKKLFALEDEIRATDIFLWSEIFRELGTLANHAEKTGDRLRRMLST